jgi:hypothetical protein
METPNGTFYDITNDIVADIWQEDTGEWYCTIFQWEWGTNPPYLEWHSSDFEPRATEAELLRDINNYYNHFDG